MTLIDLIVGYRHEHDLSQRQFASDCGLSNAYISMLERGENPKTGQPIAPTLPALKKLANGMHMTLGDMLSLIDDMTVVLSGDSTDIPLENLENVIPMPSTHDLPLIGEIACGRPILAVEDATETVSAPDWVHADFALRCRGDSMINARIFDGDVVYIRRQPQVENGEIAAVRVGEEATLKKVYQTGGRVILRACNPLFPDLEYEGPELEDVQVLGLAVAFTSMLEK